MNRKTVLNDTHRALGAKMVDFGGWDMPLNYGSQIEEHHAVRRGAGMFDVSHMTVVDLHGSRVRDFLRRLLANSVDKLKVQGKAAAGAKTSADSVISLMCSLAVVAAEAVIQMHRKRVMICNIP